ncbi:MAG TPA: type II toxin-antitoxin system prevent-host-death family antitoxin [Pirellulales bacterium]|nr:type II toxin-antitoxin system prevent-host-death family antitoxin [Pirellulales bacterium]
MLTIEDAARRLADVVEHVHSKGEATILLKSGRPVARIVPVASAQHSEDLIAFLAQWRLQHPEPDEQFADAIQESRKWLRPPRDPWESS